MISGGVTDGSNPDRIVNFVLDDKLKSGAVCEWDPIINPFDE